MFLFLVWFFFWSRVKFSSFFLACDDFRADRCWVIHLVGEFGVFFILLQLKTLGFLFSFRSVGLCCWSGSCGWYTLQVVHKTAGFCMYANAARNCLND